MSFLSPLWLWAAAAVAVPIAIHLLSRGRGRVIPVGTVRFLPATQSHRLRRIRPSGLLRLLLRAALLASLAFALAGPRYWSPVSPDPGEHWLLVDPALVTERHRLEAGAGAVYDRLDTSTATTRRLLAPGFPHWIDETIDSEASSDLWSLAAEATAMAPPGATIEIFVLDRAEALRGARPDLGRAVDWWTVIDSGSNRWIQRAVSTPDGIHTTIGESDAEGTRFTSRTVSPEGTQPSDLILEQVDEGDSLRIAAGGSREADDVVVVPAGQTPLRVSISADESRIADATIVRQAATAVAAHLGRPLVLASGPDEQVDLAVGLGAPGITTAPASVQISDEGHATPCRQSVFVETLPDPWLQLDRCGAGDAQTTLWFDGWGRPLLSLDGSGEHPIYRWHGRFDPSWSSLPEAGLPHLLLALIASGDERINGAVDESSDRRAPVSGHSRPLASEKSSPTAPNHLPERLAWVLVAMLFVADRLLVRRVS